MERPGDSYQFIEQTIRLFKSDCGLLDMPGLCQCAVAESREQQIKVFQQMLFSVVQYGTEQWLLFLLMSLHILCEPLKLQLNLFDASVIENTSGRLKEILPRSLTSV